MNNLVKYWSLYFNISNIKKIFLKKISLIKITVCYLILVILNYKINNLFKILVYSVATELYFFDSFILIISIDSYFISMS